MAGLEKIIDRIEHDAAAQAEEIIAGARAQADEIIKKAQTEADEAASAAEKKAASDVKNIAERVESAKDMYRRTQTLRTKQDVIAEVSNRAYEKVKSQGKDEYFSMIERMVGRYALPEAGEIIFSESDKNAMPIGFGMKIKAAAKSAGGSLEISKETRDIENGFVLVYGGIEQNCTLRAIFDEKADTVQDIARSLLYGKEA